MSWSHFWERSPVPTLETIVCTGCGALNRAPAERLIAGAAPKCGSCHEPLFIHTPRNIDAEQTLDRIVEKSTIPVVIDFWADWCGPCKMMAPHFAAASHALAPRVQFVKVDTERLAVSAARFQIRSLPTLVLVHHGREIDRQSGAADARTIQRWVTTALSAGQSGVA